jgi:hypothetical protein
VSEMTPENALQILFPEDDWVFDLTSRGFIEAMRRLRDEDRSLSERVQRAINSYVDHALPRRTLHWSVTSAGRKARFRMLPRNPYLARDVETVRAVLEIPEDHVKLEETDPEWQRLSEGAKQGYERNLVEGVLVGAWLQVHKGSVTGAAGVWPELPTRFRASAISSAAIRLDGSKPPSWLKPDTVQHESKFDSNVPVLVAARRLAERYADSSIIPALCGYIITGNSDFVDDIPWKKVAVRPNGRTGADREAFEVTVSGIDEYWSRKDWESIWNSTIRPRQVLLREMSGRGESGRRMMPMARLKGSLPALSDMVTNDKSASAAALDAENGGTVGKSARRIESDLADLQLLLAPRNSANTALDDQ